MVFCAACALGQCRLLDTSGVAHHTSGDIDLLFANQVTPTHGDDVEVTCCRLFNANVTTSRKRSTCLAGHQRIYSTDYEWRRCLTCSGQLTLHVQTLFSHASRGLLQTLLELVQLTPQPFGFGPAAVTAVAE
jgi:hypothetical protein